MPADRAAIVDAVLGLARFAETHADTLLEVDINPLFVYEKGVLAVDAVVIQNKPPDESSIAL
jgi:hypothetical protein